MRHRSHPSIPRRPILAVLLILAVVAAACGSDATSAPATTPATASTTAAAATTAAATTGPTETTASSTAGSTGSPAADGTPVAVSEKEFSIDLTPTTFAAGTYTFDIVNAGQFKHNLVIEGIGVDATSDTYTSGQSGALTVKLAPGTYEVYCSIPTHKSKGMDLTITVT